MCQHLPHTQKQGFQNVRFWECMLCTRLLPLSGGGGGQCLSGTWFGYGTSIGGHSDGKLSSGLHAAWAVLGVFIFSRPFIKVRKCHSVQLLDFWREGISNISHQFRPTQTQPRGLAWRSFEVGHLPPHRLCACGGLAEQAAVMLHDSTRYRRTVVCAPRGPPPTSMAV